MLPRMLVCHTPTILLEIQALLPHLLTGNISRLLFNPYQAISQVVTSECIFGFLFNAPISLLCYIICYVEL